ncbi:MAG TPA: PAS domain S-box protein [Bacteroidota bacterium]
MTTPNPDLAKSEGPGGRMPPCALIVDDEVIIARDLARRLQSLGYRTLGPAASAAQAIALARNDPPSLVLMDIRLQGPVDGIEAAACMIREMNLPVLFVTAWSDESVIARTREFPASAVLVKPFDDRELELAVELVLTRHELLRRTEPSLREAQQTYKGIFEHAAMGIARRTPEGRFTSVNPALLRMYGYGEAEELLAEMTRRRGQLYKEAETSERLETLLRDSAEASDFEARVTRKDGSMFWIGENIRPVRDPQGALLYFIETVQDITARKQAERELRLLANTVACAQDCFLMTDLEGHVLFVNDAFVATYGYPAEDLLGKTPFALGGQGTTEILLREAYLPPSGSWNGELAARRANGTEFPAEVWTSSVKDDRGEPVAFVTVARDISERKRTEEVIHRNELRLETLVALHQMTDASADHIMEFALEKAVLLTHSAYGLLAFLDEDQHQVTSYIWSQNVREQCRTAGGEGEGGTAGTAMIARTVQNRQPVIANDAGPEAGILPPGHVPVKRYMSVPVFEGTRIVAVAAVAAKDDAYDLSDARQLTLLMEGMWLLVQQQRSQAKLRRSLEEKEILLKEVHHRVKNNLQIISSLLNLQMGHVQDATLAEILRESQNRIRSMALIHERLYRSGDLSRVDFGYYVRNLTSYLSRTYASAAQPVRVSVEIGTILLGVDLAIPCGLIVNELVTNAFRHAFVDGREGEVTITMTQNESVCRLSVRDNGVGLPDGFEGRRTTTLGLQLVETLTEQINGVLEMQRSGGTEFSIVFRAP